MTKTNDRPMVFRDGDLVAFTRRGQRVTALMKNRGWATVSCNYRFDEDTQGGKLAFCHGVILDEGTLMEPVMARDAKRLVKALTEELMRLNAVARETEHLLQGQISELKNKSLWQIVMERVTGK